MSAITLVQKSYSKRKSSTNMPYALIFHKLIDITCQNYSKSKFPWKCLQKELFVFVNILLSFQYLQVRIGDQNKIIFTGR